MTLLTKLTGLVLALVVVSSHAAVAQLNRLPLHRHHHRSAPELLINKFTRAFQYNEDIPGREGDQDQSATLDEQALAVIQGTAEHKPTYNASELADLESEPPAFLTNLIRRDAISTPTIQSKRALGPANNNPAMQYIDLPSEKLPQLPAPLQTTKVNYGVWGSNLAFYNGSGSLQLTSETQPHLKKMQYKPLLSRAGGLGGKTFSTNLFIFDDTQSFSPSGSWTGFCSNSVAQVSSGSGSGSLTQEPILQDKLGEFADSAGSMRNFIPFTRGEAAYNAQMGGEGVRFGIWPGSSLIAYGQRSALLYAPIIHTNSNPGAKLMEYVGMTVVRVTVPGDGGAIAERIAPMLVRGPGIEWGGMGGIRKLSFTSWGNGNQNHGRVYIFGGASGGLFLARVGAPHVADWGAYEFYHASTDTWSPTAPSPTSTADLFITGAYSTADIFYSPHHPTFLMVYMTPYADNTVYWCCLKSPHAIHPSDPPRHNKAGEAYDYVENIAQHPWSEPQVLVRISPVGGGQYAYAGGVHKGYFDGQDIAEGGRRMLYGWTQPTGKKAPEDFRWDSVVVNWGA